MRTNFAIGDITIDRLVEQEPFHLNALETLPGLTPDLLAENRHWLEPRALSKEGDLLLCLQSYIIRTPHHTILVDSCVGNDKLRARPAWNLKTDDTFMRGLAALGLRVEDIDFVMCTHLHADHVGWNTKLINGRWVPTFPNAKYIFAKSEYDHWDAENSKAPVPAFGDSVLPVAEAGRALLVQGDYAIGDHVSLLPTPGHTPGHVAILLGREDAVLSGDLIHSPLQGRYPELSIKFDTDQAQSAKTRRSFLERFCDTRTLCCTAHFPSPTVARLTRWGDGFRCLPVED